MLFHRVHQIRLQCESFFSASSMAWGMIWYFSWSSHCFGSERDISITIGWMHSWSTETESYWVCWFSYFSANITHTWTTKSVNNQNNLFAISPTSWLILLELVDCLPLFCVLFLLASIFCGNLRHTFCFGLTQDWQENPEVEGFFVQWTTWD